MAGKHEKQIARIKELMSEISSIVDEMSGEVSPEEKKKKYLEMSDEERESQDKEDLEIEEE